VRDQQPFIEVVGSGAAEVPYDRVRLQLAAQAAAGSVADAFADANAAMTRMLEALRRNGAEQLQSSDIEIYPDREDADPTRGYHAAIGMHATVSDVSSAGSALAAAVDAGGDASRVHGLRLSSSSSHEALTAARLAAWQDARTRAEQYAGLAGRELGAVVSVREVGADDEPSYSVALAADSYSMEPGSGTVRAAVIVRWLLTGGPADGSRLSALPGLRRPARRRR
jgi:uncharacterized protein